MVKEKLKKALEDAVGYYNAGMSANDAVVKSASEHDLTVDQTDRVVESFNTAKTINYFDKNASDRTGKFELASKKDVTLALFGKEPKEKKASSVSVNDPSSVLDSFYLNAPDKTGNKKNVFAEKRACFLDVLSKVAEEKWAHGYSDHSFHEMANDTYSQIKSAEADIDSAIGTIDNYLMTATMKIAESISRSPYGTSEDKADMFKVACPHKMVIREVSKFSPLLKKASGGVYVKLQVVDTAPVDDLLKEADDIMDAVAQRTELRKKKDEFHKKAEKVKDAILRDPSMAVKVAESSKIENYIHKPVSVKKADFGESITNTLTDPLSAYDVLNNVESRKDENEGLRDSTRGALLSDLLASDPILQDADPNQVAAVYKSIIQSSPRVSLNKELVRAVLRSAVNSIAISPNDMKVMTDLDLGINKAYNLSALDSSMKDSAQ